MEPVRVRLVVRLARLAPHLVQHFVEGSDGLGRLAQLRRHLLGRDLDDHRLVLVLHFVADVLFVLRREFFLNQVERVGQRHGGDADRVLRLVQELDKAALLARSG